MNSRSRLHVRRRVDHEPCNEQLATMEPWKATALCIGLVATAIPLMILPGVISGRVSPYHSIPDPLATAAIGISLSLCTFVGLAKTLGIPLADVFIRWPDRSVVRWGAVGVLLATVVIVTTTVVLDGTFVVEHDGRTDVVRIVSIAVAIGVWTGTLEEILVRGYLLSIVGHQWNWPAAILVTSAVFGLLHNAHATDTAGTFLYVGMTTVAGVTLALVTYFTGNVWNAVAIHAAWNALFVDELLHVRVPVEPTRDALVTYVPTDVPLLFGGEVAYVTESPFAVLVFAGATVVVWYYFNAGTNGGAHGGSR